MGQSIYNPTTGATSCQECGQFIQCGYDASKMGVTCGDCSERRAPLKQEIVRMAERIALLEQALEPYVASDEFIYGKNHTERSAAGRALLSDRKDEKVSDSNELWNALTEASIDYANWESKGLDLEKVCERLYLAALAYAENINEKR